MKYRAEVDGLRALAVVPVILFHAGFELFSGGFVGVDVFFVISGYLITTILIEDVEKNNFTYSNFYERRARRILPALFFVILICIPFAWMWMLPSQLKDFFASIFSVSVFLSNFYFLSQVNYFAPDAELQPLLHTWSLAVEEQYYFLFPPLLLFLMKRSKVKTYVVITVICILSFTFSELAWRENLERNFFFTLSRFWELLAGSISAFIVQKRGVQSNNSLGLLGLAAILYSIFAYDESMPFPSFYALLPVCGVVLLVLFAGKETLVARFLSAKLFVGIGLISYSAYLWHQPLFAFARIKLLDEPSELLMAALSVLSLVLATLSWKYIEKPFRANSAPAIRTKTIFFLSSIGIVFFTCVGAVGYKYDGFVSHFPKVFEGDVNHVAFHKYVDEGFVDCEPHHIAENALTWDGFLRCKQTKKGALDWVLLGDSHAEHLFLGLAEKNASKNIAFYIFSGKPYLDNVEFSDIFQFLDNKSTPKTIFLTMHYVSRIKEDEAFYEKFSSVVKHLNSIGHKVVLLGDIPSYQVHSQDCLYANDKSVATKRCSLDIDVFKNQKNLFEPTLQRIASEQNVLYLSLHNTLCNDTKCSMIKGDTILYRDNNHLNIPGSKIIGADLSDRFFRSNFNID